jgi:hypothetical protein
MNYGMNDNVQPVFNDIRIDLRGNNRPGNDQRSQGSVPSRIARYSGK